jgi:hypothetical protein
MFKNPVSVIAPFAFIRCSPAVNKKLTSFTLTASSTSGYSYFKAGANGLGVWLHAHSSPLNLSLLLAI